MSLHSRTGYTRAMARRRSPGEGPHFHRRSDDLWAAQIARGPRGARQVLRPEHPLALSGRPIVSLLPALIALLLGACGGASTSEPPDSTPRPTRTIGPYEQTWRQSYGETDCREWRLEMNDHERFVAAADMLLAARRADGAGDLPPDDLIRSFQAAIADVCEADTEGIVTIAEVAAGTYTLSTDFAP